MKEYFRLGVYSLQASSINIDPSLRENHKFGSSQKTVTGRRFKAGLSNCFFTSSFSLELSTEPTYYRIMYIIFV